MLLQHQRVRPCYGQGQQWHCQIQQQTGRSPASNAPWGGAQKDDGQQAYQRVLRQDVAVPYVQQVYQAEQQQHKQPACEPVERASAPCEAFELNGESHTKQEGKNREGLHLHRRRHEYLDHAIGQGRSHLYRQELLEEGDPESANQVDEQHAKKRESSEDVKG